MARVKLSAVKVTPTAQTIGKPATAPAHALAQPAPSTPADVPGPAQVTSAPVRDVAANPLNDRIDYSGVPELMADIQARGQMSACSVVTREAFLAIYPPGRTDEVGGKTIEPAAEIGDSAYVIVGGSQRRLAVLEIAKLSSSGRSSAGQELALKIDVQDTLAADRGEFLAATTAENLKRKDPNAMEMAHAIRRLSRELGSDTKAGEKLGLSGPVTSQRLSLFHLSEQLQALVSDGTIPYRIARQIAPQAKKKELTPEQQLAEWQRIQRQDLTMVKSAQRDQSPKDLTDQAQPARQTWRITAEQTPAEVAEILLDRFDGEELQELLQALESLRDSRNTTPA